MGSSAARGFHSAARIPQGRIKRGAKRVHTRLAGIALCVAAAFTLRPGGVGLPPFDSLNIALHVRDEPAAVAENRRRMSRRLLDLPAEPSWLQQVHGKEVLELDHSPPTTPADAAVTRVVGRVLAVQVADCLPVLLAARFGRAIGCAHCGWRGLARRRAQATVRALGNDAPGRSMRGSDLPSALRLLRWGRKCARRFSPTIRAPPRPLRQTRGRWQCDLAAIARQRLAALGVYSVFGGDLCTYSDAARFYSYRRDGRCGRMAALIWMTGPPAAA